MSGAGWVHRAFNSDSNSKDHHDINYDGHKSSGGISSMTDKKRPASMSTNSQSEESISPFKKRKIQPPQDQNGPSPKDFQSPSKGKKPPSERVTVNERPQGIMLKSLLVVLHKLNITEFSSNVCASGSTRKSSGGVGVRPVVNVAATVQELQPKSPVHIAKLCSRCNQWIEDFSRPHVCSPHYSGMRAVSAADIINSDFASHISDIEESVPSIDGAVINISNNADECDLSADTARCKIASANDTESDSTVSNIATDRVANNIVTNNFVTNSELSRSLSDSVFDSTSNFEHQNTSSTIAVQKGKSLRCGRSSVQFCHRCHQKLNSKGGPQAHICFDSSSQTRPEEKKNNPPTIIEYTARGLATHYSLSHQGIHPRFFCPLCRESIQTYLNFKLHYLQHMEEDTVKTNTKSLKQWKFTCPACKEQTKGNGNKANKSMTVAPKQVRIFVRDPNSQAFCCMQCNFQHPVLHMIKKHSLQKHNVNLTFFSSEEQAAQAFHTHSLMRSPSQKKNATPAVNACSLPDETNECDSTTTDDMVSVPGGLNVRLQADTADVIHKPKLLMLNDGKAIDESKLLMQSTTKSVPVLQESNSALQKTASNRHMVPITGSRILIPANYSFEVLGVKLVDGKKQVIITLNQKEVDVTEDKNGAIAADNVGAGKHSGKTKSRMQLVQFKLANNDNTSQSSSASQSTQQNKNADSSEVPSYIDLENTVSSSVEEVTNKENQQDPDVTIVDNLTVPVSCKRKLSPIESPVRGAQIPDNNSCNAKRICRTRLDSSQAINPTSPNSFENPSLTLTCAREKDKDNSNTNESLAVSDPPNVIDGPDLPNEKRSPIQTCIDYHSIASTEQSTIVQVNTASVIKHASCLSDNLKEIEEGVITQQELKWTHGMLMLKKVDVPGQTNVAEKIQSIVTSSHVSVKVPNTPSCILEQLGKDCVEVPADKSQSQIPVSEVANQIIEPPQAVTKLSSCEPVQREECSSLDLTQPFLSHLRQELRACESHRQSTCTSLLSPTLPPADTQLSLDSKQNTALTCTTPSLTTISLPPIECTSILPAMPSQPFLKSVPQKSSELIQPDLRIMACNGSSAALTQIHAAGRPTTMQFALPPNVLDDLLKNPGSKVFIPVKGASKLSAAHFPFYVKLTNGRVMKIMPSVPKPAISGTQEPALSEKNTDNLHSLKADIPQSPVISEANQNYTDKKVSPEVQKQCQVPIQQLTNSCTQPAPLMLTNPNISTRCLSMPACTTVLPVNLPSTLSYQTLVGGQTTVITSTLGVSTSTPTLTATANQMVPKSFIINNSQSIMIPTLTQSMNQNAPIILVSVGGSSGHQIACPENVSSMIGNMGIYSQNMQSLVIPVPPLQHMPGHTISASPQKVNKLHDTNSNVTVKFSPPPPIIINTYPSSISNPIHLKVISHQTTAKASNPEKTSQHTINVLTPLTGFDRGCGSTSPSRNLIKVTPSIAVTSKPSETTSSQPAPIVKPLESASLTSLVNVHLFGNRALDCEKPPEIAQLDRLSKSTAASADHPALKDLTDPKPFTELMCSSECYEPEVQVAWDNFGNKQKFGVSIPRMRDLEVGKLAQTTIDTLPASVSSSIVHGKKFCKLPENIPFGLMQNVVDSKMASSELSSNVSVTMICKSPCNSGYTNNAHVMARCIVDLKAQLDQNMSAAELKSEVHGDAQAKIDEAVHMLETEDSAIPKTQSGCEHLLSEVHISNDRSQVTESGKGNPPIATEYAAATLMELAHCGELQSITPSTVHEEKELVDNLKCALDPKFVLAPKTLTSSIKLTSKVSNVINVVSETDMDKRKPGSERETQHCDLNFITQGEPDHVANSDNAAAPKMFSNISQLGGAEETNGPMPEACFPPISILEGKEQFIKPTRTLKKKVDNKAIQITTTCSSMTSPLPPPLPLPIKPLYHKQVYKQPSTSQPVVVLNHPYVDPQEVVNLMRTVNLYPGCIIKVVLSRRTLAALETSDQEHELLKQISVSIAKCRTPRLGCQTTKEQQKMLAQHQGILKMKLKRMSSNSYQVVKAGEQARMCTSRKTFFSCWFCGRVFSGQEEWASHGQRHLSEWARNWGTIF